MKMSPIQADGNTSCGDFKRARDTKLERFLAKNQLESKEITKF